MNAPASRPSRFPNVASRLRNNRQRAFLAAAVLGALGGGAAQAAELFWDANGDTANTGGSGTWDTTTLAWRPGSGTGTPLQAWVDGNDANFPSVAPATVTVSGARTVGTLTFSVSATAQQYLLTGGSIQINNGGPTTPSILMATNTSNTNSGQVILSAISGGDIMVARNMSANATLLNLGGGGNTGTAVNTFTGKLILGGTGTGNTYSTANKVCINGAGALPQGAGNSIEFRQDASQLLFTGGTAVGNANQAYTATFNNNINLNASGTATTFNSDIGASAFGTNITLTGLISGTSDLTFGVGLSGGLGIVQLNHANNTWTGATKMLFNAAGIARLGADDALPTGTALNFGGTTNNDGGVDLNGHNQTVASLLSQTSGQILGVVNNTNTLATLTINGSASTTYGGSIGTTPTGLIPGNATVHYNDNIPSATDKIALHLAATNTGTLTLTNANNSGISGFGGSNYSGGTQIDGGTLLINSSVGSATGTGPVTVAAAGKFGGTGSASGAVTSSGKLLPGASATVGTLTLSGGAALNADSTVDLDFASTGNDKVNVTGGTLALPGSGTVKLDLFDLGNGIKNTGGTNYTLFSYAGSTLSGNPTTAMTVVPPTSGAAQLATFTLVNNVGAQTIELQVVGAGNDITWKGDGTGNGAWDINTTPNWVLTGTATSTVYNNPDVVTFDDTANGSGAVNVTVDAGGVAPTGVTVNNNTRQYTLQGGPIGGNGKLIKTGTGTLVLANSSNTYSGGTVVSAGTLAITSDAQLGAVPASPTVNVTLNKVGSTSATVLRFDGAMTLSANRQILLTQSGGGGPTLTANADVTIAGQILGGTAGGVNLVKAGSGTLTLLGDNSTNAGGGFVNAVFVNAGALRVAQDVSLGQLTKGVILNGGGLQYGASFNPAGRPFTVNSGGGTIDTNAFNSTVDGVVAGTGALTKTGAGTLSVSGTANTYSGNLTVNGGTLQLQSNLTTPASVTAAGATVEIAAGGGSNRVLRAGSVAVSGGGKINIQDNKLITQTPVGTTIGGGAYDGVSGLIQSGRNGGGWGGSGIVTGQSSATSGNFTSIGIATAQQVKGLANPTDTTVFAGQTVTGSDTLVMYTYGGDANLDGRLNVDDYGHIDSSIGIGLTGWYNGDFNYDGKINVDDYGIIDFNIGIQGAQFPTAGGAGGAGSSLGAVAAVPEPATVSIFGIGVAALLTARRRRKV